MGSRVLLAAGRLGQEDRTALSLAATAASFETEFADTPQSASKLLDDRSVDAVVVTDDDHFGGEFGLEARARASYAGVPMLLLSSELDDLSFADVFSWGGDDAVERSAMRGLVSRLRSVPEDLTTGHGVGGVALIADDDRARRIVVGRVLRNAGYDVEFAVSDKDALERTVDDEPSLVVLNVSIANDPKSLVERARNAGSDATVIVTCPPRDLARHRKPIEQLGQATAMDGFAPPENVLFVANELKGPDVRDNRAHRRLLFGTMVAYRGAGRERDEVGYAYNVSEGGLYVRTLAPPEDDVIWLEMTPPRTDRHVRAEGLVRWRRRFGPSDRATVPPGFGVQLTDGSRADLEVWRDGCRAFTEALGYTMGPPMSVSKTRDRSG